jgi:hypothetical protein
VETPLQEMHVGRRALRVAAKAIGRLRDVAGAVLRHGAWEWEYELRVFVRGGEEALVDRERNYGAEGEGRGGVAEAPDVFDFGGWEGEDFGEVEVGGEGLDAGFGV